MAQSVKHLEDLKNEHFEIIPGILCIACLLLPADDPRHDLLLAFIAVATLPANFELVLPVGRQLLLQTFLAELMLLGLPHAALELMKHIDAG